MPHDAFISHASEDKLIADMVVAKLEAAGVRCWVAPRDITPGASWASSIVEGINQCKVFVIIFSAHANTSDHVRREVERAVAHGATIVPLRIEDVLPGGDLEYFLSASHWMDAITPPMERHLDLLAEKLRGLLKTPTIKVDALPPGPAAIIERNLTVGRRFPRKSALAVAGVAAIALAAILCWPRPKPDLLAADYAAFRAARTQNRQTSVMKDLAKTNYALWKQLGDAGDPRGKLLAGMCMDAGVATGKDELAGFALIQQAANAGNAEAMTTLGLCYGDGLGTQINRGEQMAWSRKGHDAGDPMAAVAIAAMYYRGLGVATDASEALRWARKAADDGIAVGYTLVGSFYFGGIGVKTDLAEALRWYEKGAAAGDPEAMRAVGWFYGQGKVVDFDPKASFDWFSKAANAGDVPSMSALAMMYGKGVGTPRDDAAALAWARKASQQGDRRGTALVGAMVASGTGVEADAYAGHRSLQQAADQGDPLAMAFLAVDFQSGRGVAPDPANARRWLSRAGDIATANKDMDALATVGATYIGLFNDTAAGRPFLEKAATLGSSDAKGWLQKHPK